MPESEPERKGYIRVRDRVGWRDREMAARRKDRLRER